MLGNVDYVNGNGDFFGFMTFPQRGWLGGGTDEPPLRPRPSQARLLVRQGATGMPRLLSHPSPTIVVMYTSVEVCAGAGGQAIGLHLAGFRHLALVEIDRHAAATTVSRSSPSTTRNVRTR